jgi:ketosteroid isomerase-like protein
MKRLLLLSFCAFSFLIAAKPEDDVKAAMESWKTAVINKDKATLEKLMHPNITYSHSSALMETRDQAIAAFLAPTMTYKALDMADTTYRTFGNTVLVQTKLTVKNAQKGVDNTLNLSALMVWVKDQGRWQMVARQTTRIPQ